ncbi:MAG: Ig-like domain-containing protein [Kangiellaceae bacterium]|nr:Ig-like domain-containing protein [Kangiellaceae bacterium]MCW8997414.1 Ig-like domain-containing protein [Kangiellaceae bacterium]
MKSKLLVVFQCVLLSWLVACGSSESIDSDTTVVAVTGVSLSVPIHALAVGEAMTLSASVTPSNASNQSVAWSSDNETVASINSSGVVTALSVGSTTITVTTVDGEYSDSVDISVSEPAFSLSSSVMSNGGSLPATYTCDGDSISPPLSWSNAPEEALSYALLMEHEAAPNDFKWYWIMYDISSGVNSVNDGESVGTLGSNSVNGANEYAAPCSEGVGEKWYTFSLYALSDYPDFTDVSTIDRDALLAAIANITLDSASLSVSYDRGTSDDSTACKKVQESVSESGFSDVMVTCDNEYAYVISDTYPSHDLMNGITGTNEQIPVPAPGYAAPIKLSPQISNSYTSIDAALGVAVNGVPIYDYSSQGDLDIYNYDPNNDVVVLGQLDNCSGHAGRGDDYHYHAAPNCMIESMTNQGDDAIIGWGYDGYPLYGNNNPDGSSISDGELDVCNGQTDDDFGYRYHTSEEAPYVFQCLVGEVDQSILPRVAPLNGDTTGARADLTPPQGGVQNLTHTISENGTRTMTYEYQGEQYYVTYSPSATGENCFDFEQKTITHNGIIETGTYCR